MEYFNLPGQRFYFIDDPELIAEVLLTGQHPFDRDNGATLLRELVGDSMITRDEPAHRERWRTLQPAFHRAQVASYAGMMVEQCRRSMANWAALFSARDGSHFLCFIWSRWPRHTAVAFRNVSSNR